MKKIAILLFLTLAISLSAIVNIYDEYIGPGPMGQFRKTVESHLGTRTSTIERFFYDDAHPDRLSWRDELYHYPMGEDYSKALYEYQEFADHRKVIEREFRGYYDYSGSPNPSVEGFTLQYVRIYTYDLQDKILEYTELNVTINRTERTEYEYDDRGNLISKSMYNHNETVPFLVYTYEYDAQNRLTYYQYGTSGNLGYQLWQTWGTHSLPDSLYIADSYYGVKIQKNFFDENGKRHYQQQWEERSAPYYWRRTDANFEYTFAHQICFPTGIIYQAGFVDSLDADFEPTHSTPETYTYSNDYHSVSIRRGLYSARCTFDENWLMTYCHRGDSGSNGWSSSSSYAWEAYEVPNDDPTAIPLAMVSAYPNPAKGNVNISLSKSSANTPTEAKVYNIKGQLVRNLQVNDLSGDKLLYNWDCKDQHNHAVPSGIYLIRIKTNSGEVSKKVTIIK